MLGLLWLFVCGLVTFANGCFVLLFGYCRFSLRCLDCVSLLVLLELWLRGYGVC